MSEVHQTDRGKWSQAGVPHRGWTCVDVEDLEELAQFCEMCESAEIRYVHLMKHPDYPETLGVGCVCAERMEEDYVNPRLREKKIRSRAHRRNTWPKRQWKVSSKGNSYLNTEGFNLVVFPVSGPGGGYWGLRIKHKETGRSQVGRQRYVTEDAAKWAGLYALLWAKDNLAR